MSHQSEVIILIYYGKKKVQLLHDWITINQDSTLATPRLTASIQPHSLETLHPYGAWDLQSTESEETIFSIPFLIITIEETSNPPP